MAPSFGGLLVRTWLVHVIVQDLKEGKKIRMSEGQVLQKAGELFSLRSVKVAWLLFLCIPKLAQM